MTQPAPLQIPATGDDDVVIDRLPKAKRIVKPKDPEIVAAIEVFKTYKPGQSFFIPGGTTAEISNKLRRPFLRAGLNMMAREVECDEIYQVAGVRVWRLLGEYDEL